jgi:hypothetical protein
LLSEIAYSAAFAVLPNIRVGAGKPQDVPSLCPSGVFVILPPQATAPALVGVLMIRSLARIDIGIPVTRFRSS